jgi:cell division protein FtsZ
MASRSQLAVSTNLPIIKVIGVGGGGGNAVSRMARKIRGIECIAVNTDIQDLLKTEARIKIPIGKSITKGMGAGMNPEIGRQAAEENRDDITRALEGADLVFITCGLGGGTGSGASAVIADCAREVGALSVAVVTKPFAFEGVKRLRIADEAWKVLASKVDAIITVPNDRVFNIISRATPLLEAFDRIDDILRQAVQGVSDLISRPGLINVDFADIRTIMSQAGPAILGIGVGSGSGRAEAAALAAIQSPLLDLSIDGARGVLFNISGRENMGMTEVNEVAKIITESVDTEARIIFGATFDSRLRANELKVTVIAAGFGFNRGEELPFRPSPPTITAPKRSPATSTTITVETGDLPKASNQTVLQPPTNRVLQDLLEQKLADDKELETPAFFRKKKEKK